MPFTLFFRKFVSPVSYWFSRYCVWKASAFHLLEQTLHTSYRSRNHSASGSISSRSEGKEATSFSIGKRPNSTN